MTTYEVTVRHTNEVTVDVELPDDVAPTTDLLTERALTQVDAGEAFFETVDGETEWGRKA